MKIMYEKIRSGFLKMINITCVCVCGNEYWIIVRILKGRVVYVVCKARCLIVIIRRSGEEVIG